MLLHKVTRHILKTVRPQWKRLVRLHNTEGDNTFRPMSVQMLSKEDDTNIYIAAYSPEGFKLSSGFRILGPCAVFPRSVLHWNVRSSEDINENSLSLFCMLEPKIDILILGIGDPGSKYNVEIIRYLKTKRINVEILPTDQACSTFNFLNSERRYVAAALIPPKDLSLDLEEDLFVEDYEIDFTGLPDIPGEFEQEYKYLKEHVYSKLPGFGPPKDKDTDTKTKLSDTKDTVISAKDSVKEGKTEVDNSTGSEKEKEKK